MGAHLGNKGFVADINVTPFVDVMLVLLIIFMVTTPMMTEGLDVDLPQTKQVESLPTEADHLVLTLRQDGVIYLDEYKVELEELEDYLTRLVREKNKGLFLQADTNVPYGMVVDIMGRIKAAGIEKLGVVARPQEERNTAPQRKK
ncbi:MAG: ExbD/TolR family protein [Desulfovibrionaceae bacterium]|nr:ExbD/TolR family protein [Desulfovibrionaceae bacterium]